VSKKRIGNRKELPWLVIEKITGGRGRKNNHKKENIKGGTLIGSTSVEALPPVKN